MKQSIFISAIVLLIGLAAFAQVSNNNWHCPDSKTYPPIDIKLWEQTPVVNGRLPSYGEIQTGKSLMYYDKRKVPDAKVYDINLPQLASFYCSYTKRIETVVVIEIVRTAKDTIVGYRYLTGGDGTHDFRDFHFLTNDEVEKLVKLSQDEKHNYSK